MKNRKAPACIWNYKTAGPTMPLEIVSRGRPKKHSKVASTAAAGDIESLTELIHEYLQGIELKHTSATWYSVGGIGH